MTWRLPRVIFVLGKGGVGRSTVSAALAVELARRGDRTLVFGWAASDPISPWYGRPPAGLMPAEIALRVHVGNYRLDETLKLYFVDHLRLPRFYRHVIDGVHVRRLIEAAPGIADVFFVGHLWWLSTLAEQEAGLRFDRIVVDAPATGHGASLLDVPAVLGSLRASGLVALEAGRVDRMMSDPSWTGALVVAMPEELAFEETSELVPRVTERLRRPPLALLVNRSASSVVEAQGRAPWVDALAARLTAPARSGLDTLLAELQTRARYEAALRTALAGATEHGVAPLREQLFVPGDHGPREVVERVAKEIGALLEAAA